MQACVWVCMCVCPTWKSPRIFTFTDYIVCSFDIQECSQCLCVITEHNPMERNEELCSKDHNHNDDGDDSEVHIQSGAYHLGNIPPQHFRAR